MKLIEVHIIKNSRQKYPTYGNYFKRKKHITYEISKFEDKRVEFGILVHEIVESFLCKFRGIDWEEIDKFDLEHYELDDPGLNKNAPYHKEHLVAVKIEKILCKELGMDWDEYYAKRPIA